MQKRTLTGIVILMMLLVSIFGTVGAQDTTDPGAVDDGSTEETTPETPTYTHPVVQLLADYFGRETADAGVTDDVDTTDGDTEDSDTEDGITEDGDTEDGEPAEGDPVDIGEQIETLHEEGMGFGVLVKIFAMAENAGIACAKLAPVDDTTGGDDTSIEDTTGDETGDVDEDAYDPCAVSVDSLVEEFKGGMGMGQLFKEHGKPELLGVGHVRQAMKEMNQETGDEVVDDGVDDGESQELDTQETHGKPDKEPKAPKTNDNPNKLPKNHKAPKKP